MNTNHILANTFWPATPANSLVRGLTIALAGSLVVAAAAQVTVPMWPVPMTLQSVAVLLVGGFAGSRLGAFSLALYAIEGAIGFPFFAGGKSGLFDAKLDYLFPAGSMGYVVGFILAAWCVGAVIESGKTASMTRIAAAIAAGSALIYLPGLVWLAIWAGKTQHMDAVVAIQSALHWGLYPFVLGDTIKALLAIISIRAAVNPAHSQVS